MLGGGLGGALGGVGEWGGSFCIRGAITSNRLVAPQESLSSPLSGVGLVGG
jgi:hypothetical protein